MAPDIPSSLTAFLNDHPNVEVFEAILPDFNAGLRGKWLDRGNIEKAFTGELKLPLSTLALDVWGRDPETWVFETGDGDGICEAEARTLAPVPWSARPTGQVLMSLREPSGEACAFDPRSILQRLMARFADHGLTPALAVEMEFQLFQLGKGAGDAPLHTQVNALGGPATGGQTYGIDLLQDMSELIHDMRDACLAQGLPIDTLISEAAPSQYEVNLLHRPDALLAADQALMLKRAVKGVAQRHGLRATFMAKPFGDLPGNGMHVHCSLLDEQGGNAFDNGTDRGSDLLRQCIAGCLASMGDAMLLLAPHLNSYRRFQSGSHAPTTPTWGYENRTVALRVPAGSHSAMRLEHRVAGADANPYLVVCAILAGMLRGLESGLQPPEPVTGDAYAQHPPSLPRHWPGAIESFAGSSFIEDYFGAPFQRVFLATKRQELAEFDRQVTPLEYEAYF